MALPLLGLGYFWDPSGTRTEPASQVLKKYGLSPLELQAKDGLSLINGTQFMSAYGAYVLERSLYLLKLVDIIAAMSLEAKLWEGAGSLFTALCASSTWCK